MKIESVLQIPDKRLQALFFDDPEDVIQLSLKYYLMEESLRQETCSVDYFCFCWIREEEVKAVRNALVCEQYRGDVDEQRIL